MELYVIRRPSAWANMNELEAAGAKSARIGNEQMSDRVRWIRSYVVHEADGRIGTFCIYEARDAEFDPRACASRRNARRGILQGRYHGRGARRSRGTKYRGSIAQRGCRLDWPGRIPPPPAIGNGPPNHKGIYRVKPV